MNTKYKKMDARQLTECYNEVIAKHEEAKMAYKAAKNEDEREAVFEDYPDYKSGHLPMTPARQAFETFKRQYEAYSDLSDNQLIEDCENIILLSPDAAEYCFHVARRRQLPWPEAEHRIAESPMWSYLYASMIIKGKFDAGEEAIHSNENYSKRYNRKGDY